jgi:predicted RNA binding protein with dsRBD fold (UPF0201 family)
MPRRTKAQLEQENSDLYAALEALEKTARRQQRVIDAARRVLQSITIESWRFTASTFGAYSSDVSAAITSLRAALTELTEHNAEQSKDVKP